MKKYDERDINDLTIAVLEAMNGTLKNLIEPWNLSDTALDTFFWEYEKCLTALLTNKSMGISQGSRSEGMELTLDNLRVPGFNCLKQMLEQINNG